MVVGITGGIGSGKSTICRAIETLGYPIYLTDLRGSYLMNNNSKVIDQIVALFSEKAYVDGKLNSRFISREVFGKPERLKALEKIVHPAVFEDFENFVNSFDSTELIFLESAILFESGMDRVVDKIITISAPEELRIKRVLKRDNIDVESVKKRMSAQMSDSEREMKADFTIVCDDQRSVIIELIRIIDQILTS